MDLRYCGVIFFVLFLAVSVNYAQGVTTTIPLSPINVTASLNTTAVPKSSTASTSSASALISPSSTASPSSNTSSTVAPSNATTPTPTPTMSTTKPPTPNTPAANKGRAFDAASFFGGIILGIVLAIGAVVGYTYWQNKRKSYHSL